MGHGCKDEEGRDRLEGAYSVYSDAQIAMKTTCDALPTQTTAQI